MLKKLTFQNNNHFNLIHESIKINIIKTKIKYNKIVKFCDIIY